MSTCPRCNTDLETRDVVGGSVEACGQCGGQYVTSDALYSIAEAYRPQPTPDGHVHEEAHRHVPLAKVREELPCPGCGQTMETFNYAADSNVILQRCRQCDAVWLDAGEMDQVGRWAALSRQDLTTDVKRFSADMHHEEVRQDALEQQDVRTSPFPGGSAMTSPLIGGTEGP